LAVRETAPQNSTNTVAQEIDNRLAAISFNSGVSISLASFTPIPAHTFYPFGTAPAVSTIPLIGGSLPALQGQGNLAIAMASQGPVGELQTASNSYLFQYTFTRSVSGNAAETRTYTVNAELYSVPVTNYDMVAYGLPSSGTVPLTEPVLGPGFSFASGVSRLVVTSNNPSNDPTAYPDIYTPLTPEILPTQFRNGVSFSWDAYEFIWGNTYQNGLLSAAALAGPTYTFNFSAPGTLPAWFSLSGSTLTVNVASIPTSTPVGAPPTIAVVDPLGSNSVVINGSGTNGSQAAFVLVVQNTTAPTTQTTVSFNSTVNRPFLFYALNCNVVFSGAPQLQGGILLDKNCAANGGLTLDGHISFYGPANTLSNLNLTLNDSPTVKAALAPIAPRVLLVAAKGSR
jgi:hypothetical protein